MRFLILAANGTRAYVIGNRQRYSWRWRIFYDIVSLAEVYWALTFVIHP